MTTQATTLTNSAIDWKRIIFLLTGLILFFIVYFAPAWPDAIDLSGKHFVLSNEGKGALLVFLLGGLWWIFEVVPIGITSLTIGIFQVLFLIRSADSALKDFMTPSVLFIFASLIIGIVFTKTGFTRLLAYKMLSIVGERTSMIYFRCFVVTAALSHIMAHTSVVAIIYLLLVTIYEMYADDDKPTNFGKGLFMGGRCWKYHHSAWCSKGSCCNRFFQRHNRKRGLIF